jgi:hypothetical protein
MMVEETAAPVKFDSAIAVCNFEMERLGAMFEGGAFGQVQELGAQALTAVGRFDEKLIHPGAFAAILEAEIEADGQVGDGELCVASQVEEAIGVGGKELREILAHGDFIERLGPGIIGLHVAHEEQQAVEVGLKGKLDGNGHKRNGNLSKERSMLCGFYCKRGESEEQQRRRKRMQVWGVIQALEGVGSGTGCGLREFNREESWRARISSKAWGRIGLER